MPKKAKLDKDELDEVIQHQKDSESYLNTSRERWLDYESMLLGEHREALENENRIFDPRVSTIEIERTARVASQRPSGKAFAVSRNDQGKNMLMNLMLSYQMDNANEQWDFVIKQMMWSFWSRVYGSMYALTPWRVRNDYIGNELFLINIYDAFPQPGVSVQDAEWFTVGNRPSIKWLLDQDPEVWNMDEIKQLKEDFKNTEGEVSSHDNMTSYTRSTWYPTQKGDKKFPKVQCFTEYRGDKWVTWATRTNSKKGREYLLRVVENDDLEGKLPVVAKYSIPMFDGPQGLGPFQRGKSLQFGTNSLLNMYMATVREKLRPQLMVNPHKAVMSSLKYDAGAYWFMENPGEDVRPFNKGSEADQTFSQAYGVMISAMLNQAGTTDTTNSTQIESALGKTPAALKAQAAAQASQDFWEQTMMESAMRQVMERWIMQTVKNLETKQALRLFEDEITSIGDIYPDATELFSDKSGQIMVDKTFFEEDDEPVKFDFNIETGSTTKPNLEQQVADIVEIMNLVDEKPQLIAKMQSEGFDVQATELFKEILIRKGLREDKIIVQSEVPQEMAAEEMPGQIPQEEMPVEYVEPPAPPVPQFEDPDINAVAQQLMGAQGGIPPSA
jgi:hypothetical protein